MRIFQGGESGVQVVPAVMGEVGDTCGKQLTNFICNHEIAVGQVLAAVIHINDKGIYPIRALPEGRAPPADIYLEPSECPVLVWPEPPDPVAGNGDLKIDSRLLYGGIESEPPDAKVFAGYKNVLILFHGYPHPSFPAIINIA